MRVGVLALQGGFAEHQRALSDVGATPREVRVASDMDDLDAVVLPGGESTTMSKLLDSAGLRGRLAESLSGGLPAFGTCAGMILLATEVEGGRDDQRSFGAIDLKVRRNAYGAQLESFESDIVVKGLDQPFPSVFIRAPKVERVGEKVEVLSELEGEPVLCRQGSVMVAAFHPELSADRRIHEMFIEGI